MTYPAVVELIAHLQDAARDAIADKRAQQTVVMFPYVPSQYPLALARSICHDGPQLQNIIS